MRTRWPRHSGPPGSADGGADPDSGDEAEHGHRRGIRVALATGFSEDVVTPLLDGLGWSVGSEPENTLDAVVTASEVAAGRPAPYMIHRAMEKTGVFDVRTR